MREATAPCYLRHLAVRRPDAPELAELVWEAAAALTLSRTWRDELRAGLARTMGELADTGAATLQAAFEQAEITARQERHAPPGWWAAARLLILTRAVVASWPLLRRVQVQPLLDALPAEDPLAIAYRRLREATDHIGRISQQARHRAPDYAIRLMLARGYECLEQITEDDVIATDWGTAANVDTIDAALPPRSVRSHRGPGMEQDTPRPPPADRGGAGLAQGHPGAVCAADGRLPRACAQPARLHPRDDQGAAAEHRPLLSFIDETYPEIDEPAKLRPEHGRAFLHASIEHSRTVRRGPGAEGREDDRLTVYATVGDVRVMFHDVCA